MLLKDEEKVPLLGSYGSGNFEGLHRYEGTVLEAFLEDHLAVNQGKQGVVFAHSYVHARVVLGTALTHDDVARPGSLSTENFYA